MTHSVAKNSIAWRLAETLTASQRIAMRDPKRCNGYDYLALKALDDSYIVPGWFLLHPFAERNRAYVVAALDEIEGKK